MTKPPDVKAAPRQAPIHPLLAGPPVSDEEKIIYWMCAAKEARAELDEFKRAAVAAAALKEGE